MPVVVASRPVMASPNSAGWPLPFKCNEVEPSSRDATARAFASPSFCEQRRRHSLWVWLHDFRPIIMINAFQLTRTNQACLALSELTRIKSFLVRCCGSAEGSPFSEPVKVVPTASSGCFHSCLFVSIRGCIELLRLRNSHGNLPILQFFHGFLPATFRSNLFLYF